MRGGKIPPKKKWRHTQSGKSSGKADPDCWVLLVAMRRLRRGFFLSAGERYHSGLRAPFLFLLARRSIRPSTQIGNKTGGKTTYAGCTQSQMCALRVIYFLRRDRQRLIALYVFMRRSVPNVLPRVNKTISLPSSTYAPAMGGGGGGGSGGWSGRLRGQDMQYKFLFAWACVIATNQQGKSSELPDSDSHSLQQTF